MAACPHDTPLLREVVDGEVVESKEDVLDSFDREVAVEELRREQQHVVTIETTPRELFGRTVTVAVFVEVRPRNVEPRRHQRRGRVVRIADLNRGAGREEALGRVNPSGLHARRFGSIDPTPLALEGVLLEQQERCVRGHVAQTITLYGRRDAPQALPTAGREDAVRTQREGHGLTEVV